MELKEVLKGGIFYIDNPSGYVSVKLMPNITKAQFGVKNSLHIVNADGTQTIKSKPITFISNIKLENFCLDLINRGARKLGDKPNATQSQ